MQVSSAVKNIVSSWYSAENIGVKTNLTRILMHGALGGSGKVVILPVDQGFEHGPDKSFAINADAYDPEYHFQLAVAANLSAYAAPLGSIEFAADKFVGQIPLILKINGAISLSSNLASPSQAMTASVQDALRLGCCAIGITIYPGSDGFYDMVSHIREVILEAKSCGLAVVIWSYPRGQGVSKEGQSAIDVCCYAGYIAATLGANIIKLKPPSNFLEKQDALKIYHDYHIQTSTLDQRVRQVMKSVFNGKRLVVFSGLSTKSDEEILSDIKMINQGGGSGSIIGRNSFQRPFANAVELLSRICQVYKENV